MATNQAFIRNFSIIAHIDHGKTTLTDVFLKLTHTVSSLEFHSRMMDSNPIEQEKGVTIKLAPVRMKYSYQAKKQPLKQNTPSGVVAQKNSTTNAPASTSSAPQTYILNLIDTPGHVDFGYEVSRSLAVCEGAILLIDASQGVQAQTLANWQKAKDLNLKIIPVINKIDLPGADIEQTMLECMDTFGVKEEEILLCSAKTGKGVDKILDAIVERIPSPESNIKSNSSTKNDQTAAQKPLRAQIITSVFDNHLGAIAYIRVIDGILKKQTLYFYHSQTSFKPIEFGFFTPKRTPAQQLVAGEVGYVATGLKNIKLLKIGDTIINFKDYEKIQPLQGFKEPTPMVFMELYPIDNGDFHALEEAMAKLAIHDSALQYTSTDSLALGNGLRVGFLGIFHAEVVRERLAKEFQLNLIAAAPSVVYQLELRTGKVMNIRNPSEMPDPSQIIKIREPMVNALIYSPEKYISNIIKLCRTKRGKLMNTTHSGNRTILHYELPLAELITDFHDQLKSTSSGFASLEYKMAQFQLVDAVKVDILVNHEVIEALSFICPTNQAEGRARKLVAKLKEVIPRQMFEIPIQAALGGKIIARETIKAYRKDVTAKLYGGDVTRRMKLLRKQSAGKKRMKQFGKIELNQEAFLAVLKS